MINPKFVEAVDLYFSEDPAFKGNGTACWYEVNPGKFKTRPLAGKSWYHATNKDENKAYMVSREREIIAERLKLVAYEKVEYMRDLDLLKREAMRINPDTGRMNSIAEARQITKDLYAAETNNVFRDDKGGAMSVSINIDTESEIPDLIEGESEVVEEPPELPPLQLPDKLVIGKPYE